MSEWCVGVIDTFLKFVGSGYAHWGIAFIIAIILAIKDSDIRYKIIYPVILLLLIFFNPLVYGIIGTRFLNGMYWRMLWLVPINVIIAVGTVKLYSFMKRPVLKLVVVMVAVAVIGVTGKFIFNADNFVIAANYYQIPQVTIDVADAIIEDMGDMDTCNIVLPDELVCSIRQYTTRVNLLYGRNAYGYIEEMGDMQAVVHDEMIKESPDCKVLTDYCKARRITYIVFNSVNQKNYDGVTEYDYEFLRNVDGYDIYKIVME